MCCVKQIIICGFWNVRRQAGPGMDLSSGLIIAGILIVSILIVSILAAGILIVNILAACIPAVSRSYLKMNGVYLMCLQLRGSLYRTSAQPQTYRFL